MGEGGWAGGLAEPGERITFGWVLKSSRFQVPIIQGKHIVSGLTTETVSTIATNCNRLMPVCMHPELEGLYKISIVKIRLTYQYYYLLQEERTASRLYNIVFLFNCQLIHPRYLSELQ